MGNIYYWIFISSNKQIEKVYLNRLSIVRPDKNFTAHSIFQRIILLVNRRVDLTSIDVELSPFFLPLFRCCERWLKNEIFKMVKERTILKPLFETVICSFVIFFFNRKISFVRELSINKMKRVSLIKIEANRVNLKTISSQSYHFDGF